MAVQLPATDPSTLTFEATVESIDGQDIALDETYFYAESGGQPSDRGTIDGTEVHEVTRRNGTTWHTLSAEPAVSPGDTITGEVDETFRRYCMAAHTASHAVYGAARQCFDDVGYGGFEITPSKVRLDLETPTPIDDTVLLELERLTNEVIWEDRPVTWSAWPAEEVKDRNDIAFNVATEVVHTEETVRIVEIEDWDIAACGGTHVSRTGDIGEVTMADRSNPGEGQTRIEFVVGPDRIERRHAEKQSIWAAKTHLGVPIEEIPTRLDKLESERHELEARLEAMEESIVAASVTGSGAIHFDHNGSRWALATVPEVGANTASSVIEGLIGDVGDVIAVAGGDGRAHLVVASSGDIPAMEVVDATLDGFPGGGGGGSAESAQAGGIDAAPNELVDYLADVYGEE